MRFEISFGAFPRDYTNSFDILGAKWDWNTESERWVEIHLLGFILFFDFSL